MPTTPTLPTVIKYRARTSTFANYFHNGDRSLKGIPGWKSAESAAHELERSYFAMKSDINKCNPIMKLLDDVVDQCNVKVELERRQRRRRRRRKPLPSSSSSSDQVMCSETGRYIEDISDHEPEFIFPDEDEDEENTSTLVDNDLSALELELKKQEVKNPTDFLLRRFYGDKDIADHSGQLTKKEPTVIERLTASSKLVAKRHNFFGYGGLPSYRPDKPKLTFAEREEIKPMVEMQREWETKRRALEKRLRYTRDARVFSKKRSQRMQAIRELNNAYNICVANLGPEKVGRECCIGGLPWWVQWSDKFQSSPGCWTAVGEGDGARKERSRLYQGEKGESLLRMVTSIDEVAPFFSVTGGRDRWWEYTLLNRDEEGYFS